MRIDTPCLHPVLRTLALVAFMVVALHAPPAPVANADAPARLRVGVTRDGITRLTPADLSAAGVDPDALDPRAFALSSLGAPVAILVTGEADGRFDPQDEILFFGEQFRGPEMDQKYTDERVYWLETGGAAGPRIASVDAAPTGDGITPANFASTLRAEQNNVWWTLHTITLDTQDTWFWSRLQTGGNPGDSVTSDLPFQTPNPAPGYDATLRLEEVGRHNSALSNYYHRTTIAVNGVAVGTFDWQGKVRITHTARVPASALHGDDTTVTVGAINRVDVGTVSDDIYANFWELDYRRLFRAWQGQLDFRAESAGAFEYVVGGWSEREVAVWDVTTPAAPRRLIDAAVTADGAEFRARFRTVATVGQRYWLQATGAIQPPASVRVRADTGLRAPAQGADAVIVTHAALRPAAEALAAWHRSHGRRALVVDAVDAYDEFNGGIYHPKAVPAMLNWAMDHWPQPGPRYLTLLGDGHWNFKGFNPGVYPNPPIMIPPYLAWVDPWQGEVPADMLFGELNGDAVPDVAVGRIPAGDLDEAWVMVNKIINYDENARLAPWQQRALFVADNYDGTDFAGMSDAIIDDYLPLDMTAQRVYLGATHADAASARAAIRAALDAGVALVQYGGHGATWRWASEAIWTTADAQGLANGAMLPLVMTFNCLDGYFAHTDPGQESMAEVMLARPAGGSAGAVSPSGLGATYDQQNLRAILMDALYHQGIREAGAALAEAKRQYNARYGPNYLLYTESYFGDPAMRIPEMGPAVPRPPIVSIALVGGATALDWPAVTHDVFGQPTTISGYEIWAAPAPYFDPDEATCPCSLAGWVSGETWSDGQAEPWPGWQFWLGRASNAAGSSSNSNRVGRFDIALVPGAGG